MCNYVSILSTSRIARRLHNGARVLPSMDTFLERAWPLAAAHAVDAAFSRSKWRAGDHPARRLAARSWRAKWRADPRTAKHPLA